MSERSEQAPAVLPCDISWGYRDANGIMVQPYFRAFMIAHDFVTVSDALAENGGYPFMTWIQAQWAEFERANGYPVDGHMRGSRSAEFTAWLQGRATDRHVQACIEGRRHPQQRGEGGGDDPR